ncbi:GNAT family N-acetyltransferase, partial [Acinetobacter higginsii]|uniref:GNAT family N-acetyltransferase n=1 Tax=Acinetobacter higginsii TaxID=70347 RepID=UPI00300A5D90
MITAHVESFEENLEYLKPLLPIHYQELALNQDKVPLSPQFDKYIAAEHSGELLFIGLRKSGELIGYFIGFVAPGLHYSTCLTCQMDIFYVHPDHRGSGAGLQLFKFVEDQCKKRGVQRLFVGSKLHKDA